MPSKVLFVANHQGFHKFNAPFMRWFLQQGWDVDEASPGPSEGDCSRHFSVPIGRSPFSLGNLGAYFQLRRIIRSGSYDLIHCHTPMGGVLARLAARSLRRNGLKVIYTSHGFHFYRGAPLLAWLLYFPIEWLLSFCTDVILTINLEDYAFARTRLHAKVVRHTAGVGVNLDRFRVPSDDERQALRRELGFSSDQFLIAYVAQFIPRKGHDELFEAFRAVASRHPDARLLLIGDGDLLEEMKMRASAMGGEKVTFYGHLDRVDRVLAAADLHVSTSRQEGQGIANLEALACGIPVLCSRIRGHVEVVSDGLNGRLYTLGSRAELIEGIERFYRDPRPDQSARQALAASATRFSVDKAVGIVAAIYRSVMAPSGERS